MQSLGNKMSQRIGILCLLVLALWSLVLCDGFAIDVEQSMMQLGDAAGPGLRFDPAPVTGCRCANSSCGCCHHIKHFHVDNDVCVNVKYLKKDTGVELTVTWGGRVVYRKEVSVRNPPALCFHVPFVKHLISACLELYNLQYDKGLTGCARLSLRFLVIKPMTLEIGCFDIPVSEDELKTNFAFDIESNEVLGKMIDDVTGQLAVLEMKMVNMNLRAQLTGKLKNAQTSDYFSYYFVR